MSLSAITMKLPPHPSITISRAVDVPNAEETCPISSTGPDPHPEAEVFHRGLPSYPILVHRTEIPTIRKPADCLYIVKELVKELRPVFDKRIAAVWKEAGTEIYKHLDSCEVIWTTIDLVRIAEVYVAAIPIHKLKGGNNTVLWIGVKPGSLSRQKAQEVTVGCETILSKFKMTDVKVAFRESLFILSSGFKLLHYPISSTEVARPLIPFLGLQIASPHTPHTEGTGGLYIRISNKLYVLTARHVVFPLKDVPNELCDHRCTKAGSKPACPVIILGPEAFRKAYNTVVSHMSEQRSKIKWCNEKLQELQEKRPKEKQSKEKQPKGKQPKEKQPKEKQPEEKKEKAVDVSELTAIRDKQLMAEMCLEGLDDIFTKITYKEDQRIIGHVVYSPAIAVSADEECHNEDWALIEVDPTIIDFKKFEGNVIYLGLKVTGTVIYDFIKKMHSFPGKGKGKGKGKEKENPVTFFGYPPKFLFQIKGVASKKDLIKPQFVYPDESVGELKEPSIFAIKHGCATDTTIGRLNGVKSFVRHHYLDGSSRTSMELAFLGYDHNYAGFSAVGDSGAVIVDNLGRALALLTGGSASSEEADAMDITYGTPFHWLLDRIRNVFPDAELY